MVVPTLYEYEKIMTVTVHESVGLAGLVACAPQNIIFIFCLTKVIAYKKLMCSSFIGG